MQNYPNNDVTEDFALVRLINNDISFCEITSFEKGQIDVWKNKLGGLVIKSSMGYEDDDDRKINFISIRKNMFKSGITNLGQCILEHDYNDKTKTYFNIDCEAGLKLSWTKAHQVGIYDNVFNDAPFNVDSIFKTLSLYENIPLFTYRVQEKNNDGKWRIGNLTEDTLIINDKNYIGERIYHDSLSLQAKDCLFLNNI